MTNKSSKMHTITTATLIANRSKEHACSFFPLPDSCFNLLFPILGHNQAYVVNSLDTEVGECKYQVFFGIGRFLHVSTCTYLQATFPGGTGQRLEVQRFGFNF